MNCRSGITALPALTAFIAPSITLTQSGYGNSSRTSRPEITRTSIACITPRPPQTTAAR